MSTPGSHCNADAVCNSPGPAQEGNEKEHPLTKVQQRQDLERVGHGIEWWPKGREARGNVPPDAHVGIISGVGYFITATSCRGSVESVWSLLTGVGHDASHCAQTCYCGDILDKIRDDRKGWVPSDRDVGE